MLVGGELAPHAGEPQKQVKDAKQWWHLMKDVEGTVLKLKEVRSEIEPLQTGLEGLKRAFKLWEDKLGLEYPFQKTMLGLDEMAGDRGETIPVCLVVLWCAAGRAYFANEESMTGRWLSKITGAFHDTITSDRKSALVCLEQTPWCPRLLNKGEIDVSGKLKDAHSANHYLESTIKAEQDCSSPKGTQVMQHPSISRELHALASRLITIAGGVVTDGLGMGNPVKEGLGMTLQPHSASDTGSDTGFVPATVDIPGYQDVKWRWMRHTGWFFRNYKEVFVLMVSNSADFR